jgi:hypothetical protein
VIIRTIERLRKSIEKNNNQLNPSVSLYQFNTHTNLSENAYEIRDIIAFKIISGYNFNRLLNILETISRKWR